jgi:hypothetical protein
VGFCGRSPGVWSWSRIARQTPHALLVVVLSGLAGCGDERGGEAHEAVTAAARATTDAGSARARLSMHGEAAGRTISIEGSEEIEFESGQAQGSIVFQGFPGLPDETTAQLYTKRSTAYARYDFHEEQWIKLPPDPLQNISTNPAGLVTGLEIALENVEEAGEATVAGDPATAYHADYDIEALLDTLDEGDAERFRAHLEAMSTLEMPTELLVDDEGALRELRFDFGALFAEGVEFEAVITLDELGAPVAFDPPRADEITTFRELREDSQGTAVPQ